MPPDLQVATAGGLSWHSAIPACRLVGSWSGWGCPFGLGPEGRMLPGFGVWVASALLVKHIVQGYIKLPPHFVCIMFSSWAAGFLYHHLARLLQRAVELLGSALQGVAVQIDDNLSHGRLCQPQQLGAMAMIKDSFGLKSHRIWKRNRCTKNSHRSRTEAALCCSTCKPTLQQDLLRPELAGLLLRNLN